MWFGPKGLTFSTDLPGTILNQVCGARRLGAPVTVKQQACGHDGTFTENLPTCIAKFIPLRGRNFGVRLGHNCEPNHLSCINAGNSHLCGGWLPPCAGRCA